MADHIVPTLTPAFLGAKAGDNLWPRDVHRMSQVEAAVYTSYEGSAIDAVEYGRQCVRYAQSDAERARRAMTQRRREFVTDNWQKLLYSDMRDRMRPEIYEQVCGANGRFCDISRNPAKTIWQETAVLYKSPAARETPELDTDAEKYRALVRGTKFDMFWSRVEFELMVFNDLLVWPTIVPVRGAPTLRHNIAAGDTVTAIYDVELGGRAEPFALVFVDSYSDGTRDRERYFWWTPRWRAIFDDDAELSRLHPDTLQPIDDEAKDDGGAEIPIANPYGEMIFTYLHVDPFHHSFWNQSLGDDLIELTLKTGRQQTLTNDLFYRSGHKQIVATGSSIRQGEKTLLDPAALIKILGDGVSAQIVDWSVDFESRQLVIDNDEARAAGTYGINPERLRKTSYQTAEGARLTERPLEERRAKMREPLADAERQYREALIRVCAKHRFVEPEALPDPDVWMEVIHAPIAYPGDPKQQLEVDAAEVALGIASPVEVLQRRYPGISRADALAKLKRNLEDQAEVARIKQTFSIPSTPNNGDAEDEENGRRGPEVRDAQNTNGQPDPGSPPGQQEA